MTPEELTAIREWDADLGNVAGIYLTEPARDRHALLAALDAERLLADRLAAALEETSPEAHGYGLVSEHWGTPIGDGPVPLADCDDRTCETARAALAAYREARE